MNCAPRCIRPAAAHERRSNGVVLSGYDVPPRVNLRCGRCSRDEVGQGLLLVLFEEAEPAEGHTPGRRNDSADRAGRSPTRRGADPGPRENCARPRSTTNPRYDEFRAANDELQAVNEELRSAGEELETSKEELQSVNEELTTVNQELKIKVEELGQANDDFRNLMNSTDIATIFLDRGLRVKQFTPRATEIFSLLPTDVGRPLLDLTHRLVYDDLLSDMEDVLNRLQIVEREVEGQGRTWFAMRVLPVPHQ